MGSRVGAHLGPVSLSTAFPGGRQLKELCCIHCWTPRPRSRPATLQGLKQCVLSEVPALCPLCPHLHSTPGCTAVTSIRLSARDSQGTRAAQLETGSLQGPVAAPGQITGRPVQLPGTATSSVPGGVQVGVEGCFLRATQHPMGHWGSGCFHHPFQACTPAESQS